MKEREAPWKFNRIIVQLFSFLYNLYVSIKTKIFPLMMAQTPIYPEETSHLFYKPT